MWFYCSFCFKYYSGRKLKLSYRVEQNVWPFKFSFQPEYSFGKMSSSDIETFTFLYWAEWNREKNDLARPRKPKLEVLGDNWLNQTWFVNQKYKHAKYKNPIYAFSYHKSEVSFIVFFEIHNYSKLLQNYFNYNAWGTFRNGLGM